MKLIEFTNPSGVKNFYVNPEKILFIVPSEGATRLVFGMQCYVDVEESENEVISKIQGAQLETLTRTGAYDRL